MKRVVIESPLRGDYEMHLFYARLCIWDSLIRGEAPYASHVLFHHEDILDDNDIIGRILGMEVGSVWSAAGDLRAFYIDLGISQGMIAAKDEAERLGQPYVLRTLEPDLMKEFDEKYPFSKRLRLGTAE